jgi:molybdopterin-guanine dinucleotide biosynthesis protein A
VRDIVPDAGPLAGILTGLVHASSEYAYVVAGDMPNLDLRFVRWMTGLVEADPVDAIAVCEGREHLEPFNSIFAARCAVPMRAALERGERSVCAFLRNGARTRFVPEEVARHFSPDWSMFASINTRADVERYLAGQRVSVPLLPAPLTRRSIRHPR